MKKFISNILNGFDYLSITEFAHSLVPTVKYNLAALVLILSISLGWVDKIFGLSALAVGALVLVMFAELGSGIYASHVKKEEFSSKRLSRFGVKVACYLILISVPYVLYDSYHAHGNTVAAYLFDWMHTFLTIQIAAENIISILENIAVIQGKDKTFWIEKIKSKITGTL